MKKFRVDIEISSLLSKYDLPCIFITYSNSYGLFWTWLNTEEYVTYKDQIGSISFSQISLSFNNIEEARVAIREQFNSFRKIKAHQKLANLNFKKAKRIEIQQYREEQKLIITT